MDGEVGRESGRGRRGREEGGGGEVQGDGGGGGEKLVMARPSVSVSVVMVGGWKGSRKEEEQGREAQQT